jgi:DNA-binding XRE family transcriptional regulator
MTTPLYALLREQCGLSPAEAAEYHDVRIDTIGKWSSGKADPPLGVMIELGELYVRIEAAAGTGCPFDLDALPCEGARDAARAIAYFRSHDPREDD